MCARARVCVCGVSAGELKELLRIFIFRGSCIYMLVKSMVYYACVRIPLDYTCGSIVFNLSPHHVIGASS